MRPTSLAVAWLFTLAPVLATAQRHQLVDIGGYRLDAVLEGSGSPVVVFEAGLGDSLDTWPPILPAIAKNATVIAYSRAGFAVEGMRPLPDIPLAVITSMQSDPKAPYVNGRPEGHVVWRALHDEWLRQSSNGLHLVTTHSGHDTQHEEPQLVIDAIHFVLDRVRVP